MTGGCHMRMRLSGREEIERWILSWGAHPNVIAPTILEERLCGISNELSARYTKQ